MVRIKDDPVTLYSGSGAPGVGFEVIQVLLRKSRTQSLKRSFCRMMTACRSPQTSQAPTMPLPKLSPGSLSSLSSSRTFIGSDYVVLSRDDS